MSLTEYPLRMPCPVRSCAHLRDPKDATGWHHASCTKPTAGSCLLIDESAHVTCSACRHRQFILKWRWECNAASHTGGFAAASVADMFAILSQQLYYEDRGGQAWSIELMCSLSAAAKEAATATK